VSAPHLVRRILSNTAAGPVFESLCATPDPAGSYNSGVLHEATEQQARGCPGWAI
jgi:hypothetical protein